MKNETKPDTMSKVPKTPKQILKHKQTRTKQKTLSVLQPNISKKKLSVDKNPKPYTKIKGMVRKFKDRFYSDKTLLINMELRNGHHTDMLVLATKQSFEYKKSVYIIDDELKYYNVSSKIYCLDYHQDCCLPIIRKIPVDTIKETIELSGISEVELALNPSVLGRFQKSEVIEGVMKGKELSDVLKKILFLVVIIAIGTLLLILYLLYVTKAFQQVGLDI